jgi:predicted nuclease with TOPRIM domain
MARSATYISEETKQRWLENAKEMGMSESEWVQAMVEAGLKKFSRDVQPDETRDGLRRKLNDLRNELKRARDRILELETQVHLSEREAIVEYLEDNPGAEYRDIVQHVVNTANSRVARLLDRMEGDDIEIDEQGRMYKR